MYCIRRRGSILKEGLSCQALLFSLYLHFYDRVIKQLLEKKNGMKCRNPFSLFIDLKKAYDSVPLNSLTPVLLKNCVNAVYVRAMEVLYNSSISNSTKIASKLSAKFPVTKRL